MQVQGHNHLPGGGEGEERVSGGGSARLLQTRCRHNKPFCQCLGKQALKSAARTDGGACTPSVVPQLSAYGTACFRKLVLTAMSRCL